jgi:nucleotide-binding universal stress UspA family protein
MNTIVVLTDFSPLSANAMDYAAALAKHTGSDVELVHIYEWPVVYSDRTPEVMPLYLPVEEIRKNAEASLNETRKRFEEKNPDLVVSSVCRAGNNIADELEDITEGKLPLAIVTGVHEMHGIETILGSTPLSLIKKSRYVVIAVPGNYMKFSMKKVVIATDLQPMRSETKKHLVNLLEKIVPLVEVVNIKTDDAEEDLSKTWLNDLQQFQVSYKEIKADDVEEALNKHLLLTQADLLITLPHHHNFWEKLFVKTHTKEILENTLVPVAAIPDL